MTNRDLCIEVMVTAFGPVSGVEADDGSDRGTIRRLLRPITRSARVLSGTQDDTGGQQESFDLRRGRRRRDGQCDDRGPAAPGVAWSFDPQSG